MNEELIKRGPGRPPKETSLEKLNEDRQKRVGAMIDKTLAAVDRYVIDPAIKKLKEDQTLPEATRLELGNELNKVAEGAADIYSKLAKANAIKRQDDGEAGSTEDGLEGLGLPEDLVREMRKGKEPQ